MLEEDQHSRISSSHLSQLQRNHINPLFLVPYPQDEADGGHSRRGHDFGTVGHEIQQRGHDALCSVVKLVAQDRRQMSVKEQPIVWFSHTSLLQYYYFSRTQTKRLSDYQSQYLSLRAPNHLVQLSTERGTVVGDPRSSRLFINHPCSVPPHRGCIKTWMIDASGGRPAARFIPEQGSRSLA